MEFKMGLFYMMGLLDVAVIGGMAAFALWISLGNRPPIPIGLLLVSLLCVGYYILAGAVLDMNGGVLHHLLLFSIIVPWGFGFGHGDTAFQIALAVQTVVTVAVGNAIYWKLRRKKRKT